MNRALLVLTISLFCFQFSGQTQDLEEIDSLIAVAERENDTLNLSRAYYKLGKYYDYQNQLVESNKALKTALQMAEAIGNLKGMAVAGNYLAANQSELGMSDSAVFYYRQALAATISAGDSVRMPRVLINLSNEYASLGNFIEAADCGIQAIKIKETQNDSTNLTFFYQKVGEVYKMAGETEKWEEYICKARHLLDFEICANELAEAAIFNDLGGIAEKHEKYGQALLYYDTLVAIGKKYDNLNAIGVANSNRATIFKLQGKIDKALEAAKEGIKYKSYNEYHQVYDNNLLAELYFEKGEISKALKYCRKVIQNPLLGQYPDEQNRAFKICYLIEKARCNFGEALAWHEKWKTISDSIRDKEVRTQIVDMEMAYQSEKKESQIELLTAENDLKSHRLNAGIVLLAVLVIVIFLILYILNIRKRQARFNQNELQQQVLRSQMNPHFIFNVLGSIQNFMMTNNNKKAASYLAQFASLTRKTLEYSDKESIKLSDELDMLRNYIELEQMRAGDKFTYFIEIEEGLESDFISIPPMLIQPFVENAIKHGFKQTGKAGQLKLKVSERVQWVNFSIEDNGVGMALEKQKINGHKSFALEIFEKRRKLIQQKHKKDFTFELINLNDSDLDKTGVRVNVNIPILEDDQSCNC